MELLKFNQDQKELTASLEMFQRFPEEKLCKVVIKILEKYSVDGESIEQTYNLVEGFYYEENPTDELVTEFATEKIKKRFNLN